MRTLQKIVKDPSLVASVKSRAKVFAKLQGIFSFLFLPFSRNGPLVLFVAE